MGTPPATVTASVAVSVKLTTVSAFTAPLPEAMPVPLVVTESMPGAVKSILKLPELATAWALPAVSVCVAETLTAPAPRDVTLASVSTTPTGVLPNPVTVLVTMPEVPVKVTTIVLPNSPMTETTPPAAVASTKVAPPVTPLPRAMVAAAGALVSISIVVDALSLT